MRMFGTGGRKRTGISNAIIAPNASGGSGSPCFVLDSSAHVPVLQLEQPGQCCPPQYSRPQQEYGQSHDCSGPAAVPYPEAGSRHMVILLSCGVLWYLTFGVYHHTMELLIAMGPKLHRNGDHHFAAQVAGAIFDGQRRPSKPPVNPSTFETEHGGFASFPSYGAVGLWQTGISLVLGAVLARLQAKGSVGEKRALTGRDKTQFDRSVRALAGVTVVGLGCEYYSYALMGSVAAETVRAAETLLYLLFAHAWCRGELGARGSVWGPALLLVLGTVLASFPGRAQLGLAGVLAGMLANASLALRTLIAKAIFQDFGADEVLVLYTVAKISCLAQACFMVVMDFPQFALLATSPLMWGARIASSPHHIGLLVANGVALYINNLSALMALARVSSATFVMASGYMRAVTIFLLMLFVNLRVAWFNGVGVALASVAVLAYLRHQLGKGGAGLEGGLPLHWCAPPTLPFRWADAEEKAQRVLGFSQTSTGGSVTHHMGGVHNPLAAPLLAREEKAPPHYGAAGYDSPAPAPAHPTNPITGTARGPQRYGPPPLQSHAPLRPPHGAAAPLAPAAGGVVDLWGRPQHPPSAGPPAVRLRPAGGVASPVVLSWQTSPPSRAPSSHGSIVMVPDAREMSEAFIDSFEIIHKDEEFHP